jgi:tripeptidyl-peptidase I
VACSSKTGGIITSGGGFSTVFSQPQYQADAVKEFFSNSNPEDIPPQDQYNSLGRAYPDVAVLGYNYIITDDDKFCAESGTSASAPVFAAMLTLINDARLSAGQPPVGFINPLLYKLRHTKGIFNDVLQGDNKCGAGRYPEVTCCKYGFTATTGFDPLTGLGSVNFANLKKAALDAKSLFHSIQTPARQVEQ